MDGGNECMEGVGEFPVNASNYLLSASGQTNPCRSSILNLGDTPRLVSVAQMSQGASRVPGVLPRVRRARKSCPSQAQVLAVLLKCLPGDFRAGFGESFSQYVTEPGARALHAGEPMLCMTPVRWIWGALHGLYAWFPGGAELPGFHIEQLGSLEDVFYQSEVTTPFHHDFIVMDVILNRSYVPVVREHAIRAGTVVPVGCSGPEEIADCADGSFRTVIAIIPSAGAFYCARERRSNAVGRANSLIPLDLSWLRLASGSEFGQGGYVKRLHHRSSAWRVSLTVRSHIGGVHQHRLIRCARQLHDADGPALPPDVFDGSPCEWSAADRAALYNLRLAGSNSVRYGGGHYAVGCHYFCVPSTCCIVDPCVTPILDIMVDLPDRCDMKGRKTAILIRNSLSLLDNGGRQLVGRALDNINSHNAVVARERAVLGGARNGRGDVGTMHPIGTRVHKDGVSTSCYTTNALVPDEVLREFVRSLALVGRHCFPDVLTVIQDLEADSGLLPVSPMGGDGHFGRVGYSVDMSVNLGNASHFDCGDASQGFAVWTETIPGAAKNWFFLMPNVVGVDGNGNRFLGLAVKLSHGVAISWDGRVLRHCTSLHTTGQTNGPEEPNLCFGSFSVAKESVLQAGRTISLRRDMAERSATNA